MRAALQTLFRAGWIRLFALARRPVVQTVLTTGLIQLANLGSGVLAARLLLPEGRGELAAAQLWPTTLAYLVVLGLPDAVGYFTASGRLPARSVFAGATLLGALLSLLAIAIGLWPVLPLAMAQFRPEVQALAVVLLLLVPCHIFGMVWQEVLRGQMRLRAWNALRMLLAVSYPLLILLFWAFGRADLQGFALAFLIAQAVPALGALALSRPWLSLRPEGAVGRLATYGARMHIANVVSMLNQRVDQMLIATVLPPAALGLYVVAVTLSQTAATLASSVAMVAWPRVVAAPEAERGRILGVYLRATLGLTALGCLALALLAPLVLRLLFGPAFVEAAPLVQILLLGILPYAARDFFILAFKAYDRALPLSTAELLSLVANAAMLLALVPGLGLAGAAWTFVAVRWLSAGYLAWLIQRDLGLPLLSLLRPAGRHGP